MSTVSLWSAPTHFKCETPEIEGSVLEDWSKLAFEADAEGRVTDSVASGSETPRYLCPHEENFRDLTWPHIASDAGEWRFKLTLHSNFTRPCYLQQCNCGLCNKMRVVVVANDLPFTSEGHFKQDLSDGHEV